MSILKTGSSENSLSNDDVHSKFITLSKILDTKLNKGGGNMDGDINMNNNTIVNIRKPLNNSDCASKLYCDENIKVLMVEIKSLWDKFNDIHQRIEIAKDSLRKEINNISKQSGNLDMNFNNVSNVKFPV